MLRVGYIDDVGVGHIPLTQGLWALCDAHWFHYLSQFNWYAIHDKHGRWYAVRSGTQYMARVVMGITDPKILVDHKDRNATLDNRESNLRIATVAQNCHNQGLRTNNTSGFKGVYFDRTKGRWRARIQVNGKSTPLGYFATSIEAARAYNEAAVKFHGEFAVVNVLPHEVATLDCGTF
jgi:hypothetical protein